MDDIAFVIRLTFNVIAENNDIFTRISLRCLISIIRYLIRSYISNDINFFLLQVSRCLPYYLGYVNVSNALLIEKRFFRIRCYYSSIYHKTGSI